MPDTTLTSAELDELERQIRKDPRFVYPPDMLRLISLARSGLEARKAEESMRERAAKGGDGVGNHNDGREDSQP